MGTSVRRVLAETGVAPEDVAGLCCDTTCCTVVALDDAGDALMPCILWMDMRAAEQTEQVRRLSLATVVPETRLVAVARLESFTAPPRARPSHDPPHSPPDAFSSRARVSRRPWPRATPRCACAAAAASGLVSAEWMIPKALWLKQKKSRTAPTRSSARFKSLPGLPQPEAHGRVLREREQRRRAVALRGRRQTDVSAREAGSRGPRRQVAAAGDGARPARASATGSPPPPPRTSACPSACPSRRAARTRSSP